MSDEEVSIQQQACSGVCFGDECRNNCGRRRSRILGPNAEHLPKQIAGASSLRIAARGFTRDQFEQLGVRRVCGGEGHR
jgi:hypothetical protein